MGDGWGWEATGAQRPRTSTPGNRTPGDDADVVPASAGPSDTTPLTWSDPRHSGYGVAEDREHTPRHHRTERPGTTYRSTGRYQGSRAGRAGDRTPPPVEPAPSPVTPRTVREDPPPPPANIRPETIERPDDPGRSPPEPALPRTLETGRISNGSPVPPGPGGQNSRVRRTKPPSGRPSAKNSRSRTGWPALIGGFTALVLIGSCALGTYFLTIDDRHQSGQVTAGPSPDRTDGEQASDSANSARLDSRATDPAPLTVAEVFPSGTIVVNGDEPAYRVLRTQASSDCRAAVSGELGELLRQTGCSQVVRGTLRPPDESYLITAGVFNLVDAAAAERAHREVKPLVDGRRGRFPGMPAGPGTDPLVSSSVQVGWHSRGHFLVYCVVARADGSAVADDDAHAGKLLFDVVELHLRGTVLERRASRGPDQR